MRKLLWAIEICISIKNCGFELNRELRSPKQFGDNMIDNIPLFAAGTAVIGLAIAALLAKGDSQLSQSNAAAVSYPDFWDHLESLQV